jgi:hypothetical protein
MASRRRTLRAFFLTLGVLILAIGAVTYRNWAEIEAAYRRQLMLREFSSSGDEIARELADRRIRQGDSVEELLTRHPNCLVRRHEPYITVVFGGNGRIKVLIAKKGVLVAAKMNAVPGKYVGGEDFWFFDGMTTREWAEHAASLAAEDRRDFEQKQPRKSGANVGALAVAGFGATFDPRSLPEPGPEN